MDNRLRVRIYFDIDHWILQKIGECLVKGIDYATGPEDDGKPYDLTYFIHYLTYKPSNTKIVGGFFTHKRDNTFIQIAKKMDFAVCMNQRNKKILSPYIKEIHVIYQPTDLEKFKPKLVLGFIASTTGGGRKAGDLLNEISKLPFITIKKTLGKIKEEDMNDFYNSLDYIIITSTIEGGPMCLTEGLACGKEIITTDVGMVDQFKDSPYVHIYDRNKPEELIILLKKLYKKKLDIRKTVEKYSRENFIDEHKKLFERLINE